MDVEDRGFMTLLEAPYYIPDVKRQRKTMASLSQDSQFLGRESNPGPLEQETENYMHSTVCSDVLDRPNFFRLRGSPNSDHKT
jgi:hypothetical protein